jgi:hypothetical protein
MCAPATWPACQHYSTPAPRFGAARRQLPHGAPCQEGARVGFPKRPQPQAHIHGCGPRSPAHPHSRPRRAKPYPSSPPCPGLQLRAQAPPPPRLPRVCPTQPTHPPRRLPTLPAPPRLSTRPHTARPPRALPGRPHTAHPPHPTPPSRPCAAQRQQQQPHLSSASAAMSSSWVTSRSTPSSPAYSASSKLVMMRAAASLAPLVMAALRQRQRQREARGWAGLKGGACPDSSGGAAFIQDGQIVPTMNHGLRRVGGGKIGWRRGAPMRFWSTRAALLAASS